jgi:hypothetical protein
VQMFVPSNRDFGTAEGLASHCNANGCLAIWV